MLYNYNNTNRTKCLCNCICGNKNIIRDVYKLKHAVDSSCGCARKEINRKIFSTNVEGQTYGYLTVLDTLWDNNPVKLKCLCKCGNIKYISKKDVVSGHTKSCGCYNLEKISERNFVGHKNQISDFGIKIVKPSRLNHKQQWLWQCQCYCGNYFEEIPARILNNHVRSCGCLNASSGEKLVASILQKLNIKYKSQYTFQDCKSNNGYVLKFDFALLNNNDEVFYLIEYDGQQHFQPIEF